MGKVTTDIERLKSNGASDLGAVQFVFPDDPDHVPPIECFEDICLCVRAEERRTKTGLILTDEDESRQRVAKVLIAGPGRTLDTGVVLPNPIKIGDVVLFGAYASAGEPLRYMGADFLLFKSRDLVGRFIASE